MPWAYTEDGEKFTPGLPSCIIWNFLQNAVKLTSGQHQECLLIWKNDLEANPTPTKKRKLCDVKASGRNVEEAKRDKEAWIAATSGRIGCEYWWDSVLQRWREW